VLPDGAHTLDVTATSSGGQHTTMTASFQVANLTGANPIQISIDRPNAQTGPLSGVVAIGGWAIDDNGAAISSVTVLVDGVLVGTAAGGSRPDVCAVYPSAGGCPNVGWNFLLDTTLLGNGGHTLEVRAYAAGGPHGTQKASFTVSN
jgi:Bacterial Ig domain